MPAKAHKPQGTAPVERTVWLTTDQAAARAGLKRSGLRSRVRVGLLREYRGSDGRPRFDAAEVDLMVQGKPARTALKRPPTEEGKIHAAVVRLFREHGIDVLRAVEELEITIDEAKRLGREVADAKGEHILSAATVKELRSKAILNLPEPEPFTDSELLDRLASREKRQGDAWLKQVKEAEGERDKAQVERDQALAVAKQQGEAITQLQAHAEELARKLAAAERRASAAEAAAAQATVPAPGTGPGTETAAPAPSGHPRAPGPPAR